MPAPTVSAAQARRMPGTMPKIKVQAVEKIMAGGNPTAFMTAVSRKANTTAHRPKEWI